MGKKKNRVEKQNYKSGCLFMTCEEAQAAFYRTENEFETNLSLLSINNKVDVKSKHSGKEMRKYNNLKSYIQPPSTGSQFEKDGFQQASRLLVHCCSPMLSYSFTALYQT